jgi:hypothetical protein
VKTNGNARSHISGNHDDHSDPVVMKDLIYTFTGSRNFGAPKDTSEYKEGKTEGTVNIPFNDVVKISAFQKLVDENYLLALERMKFFTDKHFNRETSEWFVGALLEIMQNDNSIGDSQEFYVTANGESTTKEQLLKNKSFELEPFLVGILLFVLSERRGENKKGIATLNALGRKENRKPRIFSSDIGQVMARKITVSDWVKVESSNNDQNKKASADKSEEAHVLNDFDTFKKNNNHKRKSKCKTVNNQTIVVQKGNKNINVTNNGTMNFDL